MIDYVTWPATMPKGTTSSSGWIPYIVLAVFGFAAGGAVALRLLHDWRFPSLNPLIRFVGATAIIVLLIYAEKGLTRRNFRLPVGMAAPMEGLIWGFVVVSAIV